MHGRFLRGSGLALLMLAASVAGMLRGQSGEDQTSQRIGELVKQLGADKYAQREAACRELERIGELALPALQDALKNSDDLEIVRRARDTSLAILKQACKSHSTGLELALVKEGEFLMGSPDAEIGRRADEVQHRVRITRPFLLGIHEVQQRQYEQVMRHNPSAFKTGGVNHAKIVGQATGEFPVELVSWYDAIEFCNRLSQLDGFQPYYKLADVQRQQESISAAHVSVLGGNGYRLPTEAEWEYACRAATTSPFNFGQTTREGLFNAKPMVVASGYGSSLKWPDLGRTVRTGIYPPNGLGLFDMHGNVAEWCWDYYGKDYHGEAPAEDPTGPDRGDHRVQRGGSWLVSEASCRSASRLFHAPSERKDYAGFRVARTPARPPQIRNQD